MDDGGGNFLVAKVHGSLPPWREWGGGRAWLGDVGGLMEGL